MNYRNQNPQRNPQLPREHLFRTEHSAIRLLTVGAWRGGGPLFLPATHRRRRAGGLDVYPGRCAVRRLRIFQLPRHDGRTTAVGMDQIGNPHAQTVDIQVGLPVLPDYAACHCRGLQAQAARQNHIDKADDFKSNKSKAKRRNRMTKPKPKANQKPNTNTTLEARP